ncbi:DinB family protein [Amphibacillus jilinensis]|uniref:DinB family protein n=1 Tax=Amphibacillus jilinensis TaxID=1216008 RepID=UPI0002E4EEC4|nr:DinB family protein [Amphibacillus jilinensis]
MDTYQDLIHAFEETEDWLESLKKYSDEWFFQPIEKEKWTVADIITHMRFWDQYMLEIVIPQMKEGADVRTEEDYQKTNDQAIVYVQHSNKTSQQLIDEAITMRKKVIEYLRQRTEQDFFARFTVNGEVIDQFTGYPHTLYNFIAGFLWHDHHHKDQVEHFFSKR